MDNLRRKIAHPAQLPAALKHADSLAAAQPEEEDE